MSQRNLVQVSIVFLLLSGCALSLEHQIKQDLCLKERIESPLAQEIAKKAVSLLYSLSLKTVNKKKKG